MGYPDGDAPFEALSEEHQRAVRAWSERVEAARGTPQFEEVVASGKQIDRDFLPRFLELAAAGCDRSACKVLDFFGHQETVEQHQVDLGLELLERIVLHQTDAWWIGDLGDNDIVYFLLRTPRRSEGIELLLSLAERTADEYARREIRFELAHGLLLQPGSAAERTLALDLLQTIAAEWAEHQRGEQARALLSFETEIQVGQRMPALAGEDADGASLTLADFAGEVVVIDFFGFWCAPCRKGIPVLRDLIDRHPSAEFTVLGVNAHDSLAAFRQGCADLEVSWPCIFDGLEAPLSRRYGITTFPCVLVLDREGVIRAKDPSAEELATLVEALLAAE